MADQDSGLRRLVDLYTGGDEKRTSDVEKVLRANGVREDGSSSYWHQLQDFVASDSGWTHYAILNSLCSLSTQVFCVQPSTLNPYDRDPSRFIDWLQSQIERYGIGWVEENTR